MTLGVDVPGEERSLLQSSLCIIIGISGSTTHPSTGHPMIPVVHQIRSELYQLPPSISTGGPIQEIHEWECHLTKELQLLREHCKREEKS